MKWSLNRRERRNIASNIASAFRTYQKMGNYSNVDAFFSQEGIKFVDFFLLFLVNKVIGCFFLNDLILDQPENIMPFELNNISKVKIAKNVYSKFSLGN